MAYSVQFSIGILLFSIGAGAWFAYFRLKEAHREAPFVYRLLAIVGGVISVAAALAGFHSIDALGLTVEWTTLEHGLGRAVLGSLLIGLIEEGAKLLPVLAVALWSQTVRRSSECLVFAACAGVGFATAESTSMLLAGEMSMREGLARALAAPLTHALFAAPWGLGLGRFILYRRPEALLAGFAMSVVSHGLYNLLLARPEAPRGSAALVVLALWVWLLARNQGLRALAPLRLALVPIDAHRPATVRVRVSPD